MWLACFDQCFVTVITIILLFHRRSIKTGKQDLFNITFQKSIPLSPKIFPCKNPKSKWNKTYFVNGEQLPTLILLKNSNMSSHFWLANEMAISNSFVMNVIYDWPIIVGWPLAKFFAFSSADSSPVVSFYFDAGITRGGRRNTRAVTD